MIEAIREPAESGQGAAQFSRYQKAQLIKGPRLNRHSMGQRSPFSLSSIATPPGISSRVFIRGHRPGRITPPRIDKRCKSRNLDAPTCRIQANCVRHFLVWFEQIRQASDVHREVSRPRRGRNFFEFGALGIRPVLQPMGREIPENPHQKLHLMDSSPPLREGRVRKWHWPLGRFGASRPANRFYSARAFRPLPAFQPVKRPETGPSPTPSVGFQEVYKNAIKAD